MAHSLNSFTALRAAFVANGNDGWFVKHDTAIADINQGVGGAKVNGQVGRNVPTESFKHGQKSG